MPVFRRLVAGLLDRLIELVDEQLGGRHRKDKPVYGYTIRDLDGQTRHIGITSNPRRRSAQHCRSGEKGLMVVVTGGMSHRNARRWEAGVLAVHRKRHGGRNLRCNKNDTGVP